MPFWARFFGGNTTSKRALEPRDDDGLTALHRACLGQYHPIEEAEQLIASGADVNARVSDVSVNRHRKQGWTPLHFAASANQVDKIRLLISHGAKLEAPGNAGETPLHVAISWRASASVEALVQSGANVHACLVNGLTAIEMAIKAEKAENIKVLTKRGANLDGLDRLILPGEMTKWADSVLGKYLINKYQQEGIDSSNVLDFLLNQGETGRRKLIQKWKDEHQSNTVVDEGVNLLRTGAAEAGTTAPSNTSDPVIPPDPVMGRQEAMMNAAAFALRAELDDSIQFLYDDAKCVVGIWLALFPINTTKKAVLEAFVNKELVRKLITEATANPIIDKIYGARYTIKPNPRKGGFDVCF